MIELAIIRLDVNGNPIDEWVSRFDPEGPVGATHIHGITQVDVTGAPLFRTRARVIAELLSGVTIVGHNVRFDLGFLHVEMQRAGLAFVVNDAICTLEVSADRLPTLPRRRLADCCEAVGVEANGAHSALGDARAAGALFRIFLAEGPLIGRSVEAGTTPEPRSKGSSLPPAQRVHVQRRIEQHRRQGERIALTRLLETVHLADVVDEGADAGDVAYLETLVEALQDGILSDAERATLSDIADVYSLGERRIASAHRGFVVALARLALLDLRVSRDERAELVRVAELLSVDASEIAQIVDEAEVARWNALSVGLAPLPAGWSAGEPLRVGDKIAFTGCDEALREALEARAQLLGIRVINSVSARTVLLVTDGSFVGNKADAAARFGTRLASPALLTDLLDHLQPYAATPSGSRSFKPVVGTTRSQMTTRDEPTHSATVIRAWAIRSGYAVGGRGRIPAEVVEAYREAHSNVKV